MKKYLTIFAFFACAIFVISAHPLKPSGNDYIRCSSCNGRGRQQCAICMGMGGSGNGMYYRACWACRGAGVIQCGTCKGAGVIQYESDESTLKIARGDDYYSSGNQGSHSKSTTQSRNGGSYSGGGYYGGGYSSGSSGSGSSRGSTKITCSGCGGTGACTACGGQGYWYADTGYYTGESITKKITCGSCNGTRRCGVCHGTGSL